LNNDTNFLKNEGQECKTGPVRSWILVGGGKDDGEERVNMVNVLCILV
jgi:hypothetical protein